MERGYYVPIARWLLGACLYRKGCYAEAEPLLVRAFDDLYERGGLADANARLALDYLLRPYSETGRPEGATAIISPILRSILDASRDHAVHSLSAWLVARRSGLELELYGDALALAEGAAVIKPDEADSLTLLGAAQYRAGRDAGAAASLTRSIELGGRFPVRQYAFLALSLQRLGNAAEATAALDVLRQLMQDPLNAVDQENQSLWAEAAPPRASTSTRPPAADR